MLSRNICCQCFPRSVDLKRPVAFSISQVTLLPTMQLWTGAIHVSKVIGFLLHLCSIFSNRLERSEIY